jgi:hypothetical protein
MSILKEPYSFGISVKNLTVKKLKTLRTIVDMNGTVIMGVMVMKKFLGVFPMWLPHRDLMEPINDIDIEIERQRRVLEELESKRQSLCQEATIIIQTIDHSHDGRFLSSFKEGKSKITFFNKAIVAEKKKSSDDKGRAVTASMVQEVQKQNQNQSKKQQQQQNQQQNR